MSKINLDKHESEFLDQTIGQWESAGLIDEDTAEKLRKSYEVKGFDWRRLAQYSFWIALVCVIISVASLIIDDAILNWLKKLYDTPDIIISGLSAAAAIFLFWTGKKKKRQNPERVFSNEAVLFLGVLFTASSIAFLGKTFDNGSGHFSVLFLFSVLVYGMLAQQFSSRLIWAFSMISLGSWFGTETGYQTDWSHYFLGMNYPLRFVGFGALLVTLSFFMKKLSKLSYFRELTYITGLLYLFISLWLLSIFGNFGTLEDWLRIKQAEIFYWGIFSAAISVGFTWYGLKNKDVIAREFGITFLLINIYTRYFEYLWDNVNKAVFFSILALSFWLIGRKAEKIWNLKI